MSHETDAADATASHNEVLDGIFRLFRDRGNSMYAGEPSAKPNTPCKRQHSPRRKPQAAR